MEFNKAIVDANFQLCVEILDVIWQHHKKGKQIDFDQLIEYIGKSYQYISRAFSFLEALEIISLDDSKCLLNKTTVERLCECETASSHIIRSKVLRIVPFNEYCSFRSSGRGAINASKLIVSIYNLNKPAQTIQKLFDKWIKGLSVDIDAQIEETDFTALENNFKDEVSIINFIMQVLEDDYRHLNERSREDIIEAIKIYKSNPRQAVNDIGRALEDFLRIDVAGNVDVSGCSGIIQLAGTLKSAGKITSKHNGILQSLGNIRTMGDAHGVDKSLLERWSIRPLSAMTYCKDVMLFMRSVFAYINREELVY